MQEMTLPCPVLYLLISLGRLMTAALFLLSTQTLNHARGNSFFYFDPPYRPLNATSSFNDYTKEAFNDLAQKRLKDFCDDVQAAGYHFMLSNSDCQDKFFDDLYMQYQIERVWASRSINANPNKRGKLTELLIRNYM